MKTTYRFNSLVFSSAWVFPSCHLLGKTVGTFSRTSFELKKQQDDGTRTGKVFMPTLRGRCYVSKSRWQRALCTPNTLHNTQATYIPYRLWSDRSSASSSIHNYACLIERKKRRKIASRFDPQIVSRGPGQLVLLARSSDASFLCFNSSAPEASLMPI